MDLGSSQVSADVGPEAEEIASAESDLTQFWRDHDRALELHKATGDVALSHDLYRGMPPWFNAYYAHFQRRALVKLLCQCHLQGETRAVDLGCGTGRWVGLLLSSGTKCYGFDIGSHALQYAAQRWPAAHFISCQLPRLAFESDVFDLAISVTVLQHVPYAQQLESIQGISRVLRRGGHLIACETTVPRDPSPHVFGNARDRWLQLFGQSGLELVGQASCEFLPHIRLFHWARGLLAKARPGLASTDVSSVALRLQTEQALALLVRSIITISYPLEYMMSCLAPKSWARLTCFLLEKPPCESV